MKGSLEIKYFPKGFKKQKHGKNKYFNGVVIGAGRPEPAIEKAIRVLRAVDKDIDNLDEVMLIELKRMMRE